MTIEQTKRSGFYHRASHGPFDSFTVMAVIPSESGCKSNQKVVSYSNSYVLLIQ